MRDAALGLALVACLAGAAPAWAGDRFAIEIEGARVWSGRNDVRIPGDGGTLFSLSKDLSTDPGWALRLRAWWRIGGRHSIGLLYAPLELEAQGQVGMPIYFFGETFAANQPLAGRYRFDSYRLTYRYDLRRDSRLDLAVGFTLKIRDAAIRIASASASAEKTNTGPVPLLYLRARVALTDNLGAVLEAEGLAAPQGRAEDVLVALEHRLARNLAVRAGYRFVEGGADNDEVYTFAWIHYATAGVIVRF